MATYESRQVGMKEGLRSLHYSAGVRRARQPHPEALGSGLYEEGTDSPVLSFRRLEKTHHFGSDLVDWFKRLLSGLEIDIILHNWPARFCRAQNPGVREA